MAAGLGIYRGRPWDFCARTPLQFLSLLPSTGKDVTCPKSQSSLAPKAPNFVTFLSSSKGLLEGVALHRMGSDQKQNTRVAEAEAAVLETALFCGSGSGCGSGS